MTIAARFKSWARDDYKTKTEALLLHINTTQW